MNRIWQFELCTVLLCGPLACSSDTSSDGTAQEPSASDTGNGATDDAMNVAGAGAEMDAVEMDPNAATGEAGLHRENGSLVFRTEPFTVPAGEERYLCWALTTQEQEVLKVNAIDFPGAQEVHHFMFAQTVAPEPEGFSECGAVLLPSTWRPLFSAGAGANSLRFPAGVAHHLQPGTQLVIALHLLNATDEEIVDQTAIQMETTDEADTQPVEIGGFGSFRIQLPPSQTSAVTHECTLPSSARMVALMPHMHLMATSMTLELGPSADDMQVIYSAREPWDFEQQTIDIVDMNVEQGQHARVTCTYNNTTDRTITYGESTFDEMCFLGAFWVGTPVNCVGF